MLATHLLTHTFQHTLFDWLKFTWVPPNHVGPIYFWWVPCEFWNKSHAENTFLFFSFNAKSGADFLRGESLKIGADFSKSVADFGRF